MSSAKWHPFCLGLNVLRPVWHPGTTWTNADLWSIRPGGTYIHEIEFEIKKFLLKIYAFDSVITLENGSHFVQAWRHVKNDIDGLVQERRNSSALAMELHLSCINPSIWNRHIIVLLWLLLLTTKINSSPPGQNGRHFTDDNFKCIFMNEKFCILIPISLKFVPKGLIDNMSALVQVMAWCLTGDKPIPEPVMTHFTDAYMQH